MSSLREHAGLALAALHEVSKEFDQADTAQDRRHALANACVESEASLTRATQELKLSKDQLAQVTVQLKAKSAILEDQQARAKQDMNAKVAAAQGELWELQGRIEKARQAIKDTDASMGSLIKRLRVG